jgi:hypothetical protein
MPTKKTDLEYVRAWFDTLVNPIVTEQDRSKALRDMIRVVLTEYDPQVITGRHNTTKFVHSESQ